MLKKFAFSLLALVLFCGVSNADFIIDDFGIGDNPDDALANVTSPNPGISIEVTSTDGTASYTGGINVYSYAADPGESLTIRYDWAGVYEDIPGTKGLDDGANSRSLASVPFGDPFGPVSDWTLSIFNGTSTTNIASIPSFFPPYVLTGATELELTFTYVGAGVGFGQFGGSSLIATPEPTSMIMFGSVAAFGLARRRRKA